MANSRADYFVRQSYTSFPRKNVVLFILFISSLPLSLSAQEVKPEPIAAKIVTLETVPTTLEAATDAIQRSSGIVFHLPLDVKSTPITAKLNGPFWVVAEQLAAEAKCRIRVQSGKVHFIPLAGAMATPTSIDGPFRVSVRQVVSKRDFETGTGVTEMHLDVAWEPRFPVYLIDADARITAVKGGAGTYSADTSSGRVPTTGYSHTMVVRLKGIPREEQKLDVLSGTLHLIAAQKMLAVEFKDLTSDKPIEQTVEGVKVALKPVKSANGLMEFAFNLEYPPSHPEFESFQTWAATNKLRLIDPTGKTLDETKDYNTTENGRKITASYFFPAPKGPLNLKGWRAVYETPSPMVQQEVRFTLKDVVLP